MPPGKTPEPRSACGLAALSDGRLLLTGGYSRLSKQGKDQGLTHSDMFYLVADSEWWGRGGGLTHADMFYLVADS